ncbi:MAG: phospholipase D family protein [Gammaproteobacteria bacterium]|nr:phospholipase D family protein [Gammaproteobacteria bacterium]
MADPDTLCAAGAEHGLDIPARFARLDHNATALAVRLELCASARHRLDLQCYIFRDDDSGRVLADALVAAAQRGVRVRLLLDDLDASGRESAFGRMDAHPGFDVRLFNPLPWRGLLRPLSLLRDPGRINRRMHAKALIADDTLAVLGGRNVGDEYFAPEAELAFADIDVLIRGDLAREVGESFDLHWHSPWAKPLAEVRGRRAPLEAARRTRERLARPPRHKPAQQAMADDTETQELLGRLRSGEWPDLPGKGRLFADLPAKVEADGTEVEGYFDKALQALVTSAEREIMIMTPYLVPREEGMAVMQALRDRGLRVRILTNSLAATDVVAVHGGYRRYRRRLLELGVELYEYRPTGFWGKRLRRFIRGAHLRASLHAKTLMVDDHLVLIGSANLDPRSHGLNLELGVAISSAPLAAEIRTCFEDAILPVNAWRLGLDGKRLYWEGAGRKHEPEAGWGRRLLSRLLGYLPLEGQL